MPGRGRQPKMQNQEKRSGVNLCCCPCVVPARVIGPGGIARKPAGGRDLQPQANPDSASVDVDLLFLIAEIDHARQRPLGATPAIRLVGHLRRRDCQAQPKEKHRPKKALFDRPRNAEGNC
jgi:hypothetical protein